MVGPTRQERANSFAGLDSTNIEDYLERAKNWIDDVLSQSGEVVDKLGTAIQNLVEEIIAQSQEPARSDGVTRPSNLPTYERLEAALLRLAKGSARISSAAGDLVEASRTADEADKLERIREISRKVALVEEALWQGRMVLRETQL